MRIAPDDSADPVAVVEAGQSVAVLGRAPIENWLYVRNGAGAEGFVWQPDFHWPGDLQALPVRQPAEGWMGIATGESAFALEYLGCQPHAFDLGSVKGQVFDQAGAVIAGALVEIWINDSRWDDPANPAATNEDGWYEWILALDQSIRFSALIVDGRRVSFSPNDVVIVPKSGCFQHVNFRQQ